MKEKLFAFFFFSSINISLKMLLIFCVSPCFFLSGFLSQVLPNTRTARAAALRHVALVQFNAFSVRFFPLAFQSLDSNFD